MRWLALALGPWICPRSAQAEIPLQAEVVGATTFVPTLWAPQASTPTLTGPITHGGVFNPSFRFGLSGTVIASLPASSGVAASWGLWRDQALCDTCDGGRGPGALGSELLGSTDLTLSFFHVEGLSGDESGNDPQALLGVRSRTKPMLVLRADVVLPASRDALFCNTMYAAPGLGATFRLPVGGSTVSVGVSARRPFYRHDAAPVGLCAPALRGSGTVQTLTGPVEPTPWNGTWFGASNPSLSGAAVASWAQVHAVVPRAPTRLRTGLSLGLSYQRFPVDPAVRVQTLTGAVDLDTSNRPLRVAVPWSIEAGWGLTSSLDLTMSLSNRVPTVLADPGGTLRAMPASTALTVQAAARF